MSRVKMIFKSSKKTEYHVYEFEFEDLQALNQKLESGYVLHELLGERWSFEMLSEELGIGGDSVKHLKLSFKEIRTEYEIQDLSGILQRKAAWEIVFSAKSGKEIWSWKGTCYCGNIRRGENVTDSTQNSHRPDRLLAKDLIFEDNDVKKKNGFIIKIVRKVLKIIRVIDLAYAFKEIDGQIKALGRHYLLSQNITENLAKSLTLDAGEDMIFNVSEASGSGGKRFYAWRHVLKVHGGSFLDAVDQANANSVIATPAPPSPSINLLTSSNKPSLYDENSSRDSTPTSTITLFSSSSNNSSETPSSETSSSSTNSLTLFASVSAQRQVEKAIYLPHVNRTKIDITDMSANTLHNLLYYLYTGKVNLRMNFLQTVNSGCPKVEDPFELYSKAELYHLNGLKQCCLHYLKYTCTPGTVCTRLFNENCRKYPELEDAYIQYLARNFEIVKEKEEWINFSKRVKKNPGTADAKLFENIMSSIDSK